jgi:DNA-binding CsgD family transcriptional regulator/pimeloyl-ACP methyl ester carboxylesterase
VTFPQGNMRSVFHDSLLEHAKQGRALDAMSDGWEVLDFRTNEKMSEREVTVWNEVAVHSSINPALSSHAAPGSFAAAILSPAGKITFADPNFSLWLGSAQAVLTGREARDLIRLTRSGRAARRLLADRSGRPILVTGLERHVGLCWPLSEGAKAALSHDERAICLVAFAPTRSEGLLQSVKTTFSLTLSEAKLAIALLQHDSLEDAALAIGITEMTANGYRKSLFKKLGVKRRGELVQIILEIGHRERCNDPARTSLALREMFNLSHDQMRVLDQLAAGATIPEAAKALSMNVHTAREHVRTMFDLVGVNKQSELVRVALEYSALVSLSVASEVNSNSISDLLSNTRVIARPSEGLIYLADYGAKDAAPVIIFHAGLGTRRVVPNFLREADRAGLRIISIERPGFGGTDLRPEPGFEGSSQDTAFVMDKLGLETAIIASIGGGNISALSFADAYPSRVRAGLLINPTPPPGYDLGRKMPGIGLRKMTLANPTIIRAMATAFRNQTRSDLLDAALEKYFSTCEADRMAMKNPEIRALQRASTQAAMARTIEGFVREEEAFVNGWSIPTLDCGPWAIAVGLDDHTCDAKVAQETWQGLPGFRFVAVKDAGRLIMASRPALIIETLVALTQGRIMPVDPRLFHEAKTAA